MMLLGFVINAYAYAAAVIYRADAVYSSMKCFVIADRAQYFMLSRYLVATVNPPTPFSACQQTVVAASRVQ